MADVQKKSSSPLLTTKFPSKFNIAETLKPKQEEAVLQEKSSEKLPTNHFTETDLATEWQAFLGKLKERDIVLYSAINGFKLSKKDEDTIGITYPSETARAEFEKISSEFLNHFRHKVSHYSIKTDFKMDVTIKKEVLTRRKLFEKFADINPLLHTLNDIMKFDLS